MRYNNEDYRRERETYFINKFNTFYQGINREIWVRGEAFQLCSLVVLEYLINALRICFVISKNNWWRNTNYLYLLIIIFLLSGRSLYYIYFLIQVECGGNNSKQYFYWWIKEVRTWMTLTLIVATGRRIFLYILHPPSKAIIISIIFWAMSRCCHGCQLVKKL